MNYGFYDPPSNGKSGKFLEEERPFVDYPLLGSPPVLEVCSKHVVESNQIFHFLTIFFLSIIEYLSFYFFYRP